MDMLTPVHFPSEQTDNRSTPQINKQQQVSARQTRKGPMATPFSSQANLDPHADLVCDPDPQKRHNLEPGAAFRVLAPSGEKTERASRHSLLGKAVSWPWPMEMLANLPLPSPRPRRPAQASIMEVGSTPHGRRKPHGARRGSGPWGSSFVGNPFLAGFQGKPQKPDARSNPMLPGKSTKNMGVLQVDSS